MSENKSTNLPRGWRLAEKKQEFSLEKGYFCSILLKNDCSESVLVTGKNLERCQTSAYKEAWKIYEG